MRGFFSLVDLSHGVSPEEKQSRKPTTARSMIAEEIKNKNPDLADSRNHKAPLVDWG